MTATQHCRVTQFAIVNPMPEEIKRPLGVPPVALCELKEEDLINVRDYKLDEINITELSTCWNACIVCSGRASVIEAILKGRSDYMSGFKRAAVHLLGVTVTAGPEWTAIHDALDQPADESWRDWYVKNTGWEFTLPDELKAAKLLSAKEVDKLKKCLRMAEIEGVLSDDGKEQRELLEAIKYVTQKDDHDE